MNETHELLIYSKQRNSHLRKTSHLTHIVIPHAVNPGLNRIYILLQTTDKEIDIKYEMTTRNIVSQIDNFNTSSPNLFYIIL